jgi:hypothetical protein
VRGVLLFNPRNTALSNSESGQFHGSFFLSHFDSNRHLSRFHTRKYDLVAERSALNHNESVLPPFGSPLFDSRPGHIVASNCLFFLSSRMLRSNTVLFSLSLFTSTEFLAGLLIYCHSTLKLRVTQAATVGLDSSRNSRAQNQRHLNRSNLDEIWPGGGAVRAHTSWTVHRVVKWQPCLTQAQVMTGEYNFLFFLNQPSRFSLNPSFSLIQISRTFNLWNIILFNLQSG